MSSKAELMRDPYVRILLASGAGRAVRLSPDEVRVMSLDDAIETRAYNVIKAFGFRYEGGRLVKENE
jgi:hypothetical protein